jgi:hypothetical protein
MARAYNDSLTIFESCCFRSKEKEQENCRKIELHAQLGFRKLFVQTSLLIASIQNDTQGSILKGSCRLDNIRLCRRHGRSDGEDCDGEVMVGHEAFAELQDGDEVAHPWARKQRCMRL